jgi:hypothetical protein
MFDSMLLYSGFKKGDLQGGALAKCPSDMGGRLRFAIPLPLAKERSRDNHRREDCRFNQRYENHPYPTRRDHWAVRFVRPSQ